MQAQPDNEAVTGSQGSKKCCAPHVGRMAISSESMPSPPTGQPPPAFIDIGGRRVGEGASTFIIAELSANHGASWDRAVELVEQAVECGVDAVKVQTFRADAMSLDGDQPWFRVTGGTLWDGETLHGLYKRAAMPWEWTAPLKELAERRGVQLFSSPFDAEAVDFLDALEVPAFKIASFELVDLALIERAASTGRPLILSTGMASRNEIDDAVRTARAAGGGGIALLRCNSAYPAPPDQMDLRTITDMGTTWSAPVGLSDHTLGIGAAVAAVSLGASILEKHFTLSRAEPGPDSAFSLEPPEFHRLVEAVREAESALGGVRYGPSDQEKASLAFRRSLFVVADVRAGDTLDEQSVRSIRPANGLAPKCLPQVLGRRAAVDIARGTPLDWALLTDVDEPTS